MSHLRTCGTGLIGLVELIGIYLYIGLLLNVFEAPIPLDGYVRGRQPANREDPDDVPGH